MGAPSEVSSTARSRARLVAVVTLAGCVLLGWVSSPLFGRPLVRHTSPSPPSPAASRAHQTSDGMHCGRAPACGVLALETGYGPSYYHHDMPSVHGLWPELPPYGNSPCLAPASLAPPKPGLPACYNFPSVNPDHQEVFVTHEWDKHGKCAGVASQADFFAQVCALAAAPLHVMADVRRAGGDLAAIANAVATAGFEVFSVDTHNSQLMLSACGARNSNGTLSWKLAATNQFDAVCGSGGSGPTPAPGPAPSPDGPSRCVPNVHGPPCADDAQCASISGCLRCARSGFCTSTPLPSRP